MTAWTKEMLDTLAGVVSVQAGELEILKGISDNNTATMLLYIEEQRRDRQVVVEVIEEQRLDRQESTVRWNTMQTEIRGLQTENRRILERLENRDQP